MAESVNIAYVIPKRRMARFISGLQFATSQFWESKMAFVGLTLTTVLVLVGLLAPVITKHDPNEMYFDKRFAAISREHILGCDNMGRDVWSRLAFGAQQTLWVGFIVIGTGMTIGIIIGSLAGYYGKWTEIVIMRTVDAWLAMPGLILFLVIMAILGPGLHTAIIALSVGGTPSLVRLVRGLVLSEKNKEYIEAARIIGESDRFIMFRHILPNIISPLLVIASVRLSGIILAFAGLSFLGLGPPPPDPSWGLMLSESRAFLETHPTLAIIPGVAISLAVIGVNLFGDGLRDILDPRLADK
jgi:peptide/nickel transport system permease protein